MAKLFDIPFSDIYFTPEGEVFIPDGKTRFGLKKLSAVDDLDTFRKRMESTWTGEKSSYSVVYDGMIFRVERVEAFTGVQYCARRMPQKTPDIRKLGLPDWLIKHMMSLNNESGLVLWSGPTGMGKTTSISCLLRRYMEREGGYAYTIEDPPELPLDGIYQSKRGGLGLCKQTEPPNADWGAALKSALRSRPRYILVGEIRTPETASEVLRAATSGHLVLSTIHGNSVQDALASIVKYASATELTNELASDLLSRGLLAALFQKLQGTRVRYPEVRFAFANPETQGCPVRALIRSGSLNLATVMEAQTARLFKGDSPHRNPPDVSNMLEEKKKE